MKGIKFIALFFFAVFMFASTVSAEAKLDKQTEINLEKITKQILGNDYKERAEFREKFIPLTVQEARDMVTEAERSFGDKDFWLKFKDEDKEILKDKNPKLYRKFDDFTVQFAIRHRQEQRRYELQLIREREIRNNVLLFLFAALTTAVIYGVYKHKQNPERTGLLMNKLFETVGLKAIYALNGASVLAVFWGLEKYFLSAVAIAICVMNVLFSARNISKNESWLLYTSNLALLILTFSQNRLLYLSSDDAEMFGKLLLLVTAAVNMAYTYKKQNH